MNNQSNESWTELLKNASIKEMKLILYLQYLLYGIISKWFFFFCESICSIWYCLLFC